MPKNSFYQFFVDVLRDAFDFENQIIAALPKVIQAATSQDLKEALSTHLDETKDQVNQLKKIFKALNENPTGEPCAGMSGIIEEGTKEIKQNTQPALRDAAIIVACQKIEHYEISTYGSARTLARHLSDSDLNDRVDFDEIADVLQDILDQESDADEKLTEVAEGGFFSEGVNDEAERESREEKDTRQTKNTRSKSS